MLRAILGTVGRNPAVVVLEAAPLLGDAGRIAAAPGGQ
jgi:hypothetical protein